MQPKDRRRDGDRRGNAAPASSVTVVISTGRRYLYPNIYFASDDTLASLGEQILVAAMKLTDANGLKVRAPSPVGQPDANEFVRSVARKAIEAMCGIAVEDLEERPDGVTPKVWPSVADFMPSAMWKRPS